MADKDSQVDPIPITLEDFTALVGEWEKRSTGRPLSTNSSGTPRRTPTARKRGAYMRESTR